MSVPISDGVSGRLSKYLSSLGQQLPDSHRRASFAIYALGLVSNLQRKRFESIAMLFVSEPDEAESVQLRLKHFLGAALWPDDEVRRTAVRFGWAALTRRARLPLLRLDGTAFPIRLPFRRCAASALRRDR